MLKTLVMTTGEFEFDTIFVNEQALVDADLDLLFPTLTTIIWVIFIVTMPILFNNLLVCSTTSPHAVIINNMYLGWSGSR